MSSYTLNIAFDQAGLSALAASGQSVTISKQSAGGKQTAWLSFAPQSSNIITWTEQYSVYASTTEAQAGAIISTSSESNAIGGSSYNVNNAGFFDPGIATGGIDTNTYAITNSDPNLKINGIQMVTAGLVQGATVNGTVMKAPICAVGVLFNQVAHFTPIETIMVYTSSYSSNGIVISTVAGNALTVQYSTNTTASISYNDQNNSFILAS